MAVKHSAKLFPHLWYVGDAEEAARFYVSIFADSSVDRVTYLPTQTLEGEPSTVQIVDFTLLGQRFQAMGAGPHHPFNDAISFVVLCEDQAELDRYWDALLAGGGQEQACGWLMDRFGVRWQIIPAMFDRLMSEATPEQAQRVSDALMQMVKIDIAALEAAFRG